MEEFLDAIVPGGWKLPVAVGLGAALFVTRGFRPLAKEAVKGFLIATDQVHRVTSGAKSGLQDIYAEAKAERKSESEEHPSEIVAAGQGGQPQ